MTQEDNINASVAHIVLCCVAGNGISGTHIKSYSHPGMHANYFIHGLVGFLHYQSGTFNTDFKSMYTVSYHASRYLALPCLNADLYREDSGLSAVHLVSGLVPFAMALAGSDNRHFGNIMIACNIVSLCVFSHKNDRIWGWYTALAAFGAYFFTSHINKNISYPLFLALTDYCAYKVYSAPVLVTR